MMMKRMILGLFACVICSWQANAQKWAMGYLAEYMTGAAIPDSALSVEVMRADSTFLDTVRIETSGNGRQRKTQFLVRLPEAGRYIISVAHPDYEPLCQPVDVKFYRRELGCDLGTFRLRRVMRHDLGEVEVKASKIKFYFKNDTLVYNADAFITQDGFMLEDILRKMPGLTFKNGEIYSNGRKIDALLLNGKDFFDQDRQTLLANLPAYMVKNVKVYDKTKDTLSLYERERNFEGLAMDIRLKREYTHSAMGNAEVGGGTDERYLARLFGMKIHDLYRFSAYAGSNNISSNDMVSSGYFTNIDYGPGEKKFHFAGLNYNMDEKDGKYSASGSVRAQVGRKRDISFRASEQYYQDGNVFGYSGSDSRTRDFSIQTRHDFTLFQQTPWSFTLSPQLSYIHSVTRSENHSISAEQSLDWLCPGNMADSLFSPALSNAVEKVATNRMDGRQKSPMHQHFQSLSLKKTINIQHTPDLITFMSSATHWHTTTEMFNVYQVDYFRNASVPSDFRRQYQDLYNDSWDYNADLRYQTFLSKTNQSLGAALKYVMKHKDSNDMLYMLNRLDGWGLGSAYPLDSLPGQDELVSVTDFRNSKRHIHHDNRYLAELTYEASVRNYGFKAVAAYRIEDSRLTFRQKDNDSRPSRVMAHPRLFLEHNRKVGTQKGWGYYLQYTLDAEMAPLINLVDQVNDADALSIYYGNPDLKNMTSHTLNCGYTWKPKPMDEQSLTVTYFYQDNPITTASYYDRKNGRYVRTPMNTDNFQAIGPKLTNCIHLGKASNHALKNEILLQKMFYKAFSGTTEEEYLHEYTMHNTNLTERLTYSVYSPNTKYMGTLTPYVKWMKSISEKKDVSPVQAWHFGVQVSGQVELPWSVRMKMELTSTSRRGYDDSGMNDNEVLWNLNATKSFGEKITLSLEGFDILNQRKSVTREMTASGRVESVHNLLRRYVMLHFIWKVSSKPKKG